MMGFIGRVLTPRRRAAGMVAVAAGAILWHVLACTESPMAFSPDGRELAFVTMEPYGLGNLRLAGTKSYRLCVISGGKDLRVVEETVEAMLTGPGWRPDGKEIAYVRIPLLTVEQLRAKEKEKAAAEARLTMAMTRPAGEAGEEAWQSTNLTLPDNAIVPGLVATMNPATPAELVIRRTGDWAVVKTIPLLLRGLDWPEKEHDTSGLLIPYMETRPQYSPDGQWIYLSVGGVLMALDPASKQQRILAAPASFARLSPDGRTVAFVNDKTVGLVASDGGKATYVRTGQSAQINGLAWAGNDTVALLSDASAPAPAPATRPADPATVSRPMVVTFLSTDGSTRPARTIRVDRAGNDLCEMALSPDGERVAVSFVSEAVVLDRRGKVLNRIEAAGEQARLITPAFSRDSKTLAMRLLHRPATEIIFFTADGKELSRVTVPAIKPGTTRPASQPASQTGPANEPGA